MGICICCSVSTYSQRNFDIDVYNGTPFNLTVTAYSEQGQGIFYPFNSFIEKGKSRHYTCKQDAVLKGVEGRLKLKAGNNEVPGVVDIYFDNPAVGDLTCTANADWPYRAVFTFGPERNRAPNAVIEITADTTHYSNPTPSGIRAGGSRQTVTDPYKFIPAIINFDWQVSQRMRKDDDDKKDGKAYNEVVYFFTSDGDYAATKREGASFSLMVYTKEGTTLLIDDKSKTITVMNMPKIVGEGGAMGKKIAEKINKGPLKKQQDDEKFTITKTGKTKSILGYTADEYRNAGKSGTMSFWYAKVPFDPVKIYTMGAGRPADISKIQNDPKMKNNMFAIPLLTKNYLWVQTDGGGITGMETTEIRKVNNTIRTAGYKIKQMRGLKDMLKGDDN